MKISNLFEGTCNRSWIVRFDDNGPSVFHVEALILTLSFHDDTRVIN